MIKKIKADLKCSVFAENGRSCQSARQYTHNKLLDSAYLFLSSTLLNTLYPIPQAAGSAALIKNEIPP
jgi:hypothetical protein